VGVLEGSAYKETSLLLFIL